MKGYFKKVYSLLHEAPHIDPLACVQACERKLHRDAHQTGAVSEFWAVSWAPGSAKALEANGASLQENHLRLKIGVLAAATAAAAVVVVVIVRSSGSA